MRQLKNSLSPPSPTQTANFNDEISILLGTFICYCLGGGRGGYCLFYKLTEAEMSLFVMIVYFGDSIYSFTSSNQYSTFWILCGVNWVEF